LIVRFLTKIKSILAYERKKQRMNALRRLYEGQDNLAEWYNLAFLKLLKSCFFVFFAW